MFSGGGVTAGAARVSGAVALSVAAGLAGVLLLLIMPMRLLKKEPLSSENMPLSLEEMSMVLWCSICSGW